MSMAVARFGPHHGTCHDQDFSAVRTDMSSTSKRPSDDTSDSAPPVVKAARTDSTASIHAQVSDHGNNSNNHRKKMAGSSRTGQACDRCKIRKIRCDARPGGCSPCMQNQTECKTTDRITGRATSRGHTENLESENTTLRLYIIELQAQLKENGLDPRSAPAMTPTQSSNNSLDTPSFAPNGVWESQHAADSNNNDNSNNNNNNSATAKHADGAIIQASLLPDFRPGCTGDNYLGVVSENSWLSPIEGTSLTLFGTKLDLADFMPQEPTPELAAMSYETFLEHAFGRRPVPQPPQLPEYDSCRVFADWYFRSITPFVPILHKPDFMRLLDQIYLENHQTSPAETVMVHMMLALMNFQWSARNKSEQSRKQSFEHYHYSLTFIPQLIASHQLADLQALALICAQLRNQPRTGAAWWFTDLVIGLAVESGLHRSVNAWQRSEFTTHIIEMRKRVFWSLVILHVSMSVKLGRPMPLRLEDFDVEIPEPLPDHLPGEVLPKWKRCSFRAGVQGMKMCKILMGVYNTIYSVRLTSGPYEVHVRQLEKDLEAFRAQLPPELQGGSQTREEERVYALYLQFAASEIQLLLHHPSLCRSQSPRTIKTSFDTCLEATASLLDAGKQLKQIKGLDTTWYTCMTLLAAVFTTLFIYNERRDQISMADLQTLKEDMADWIDVMGEVGQLLGSDEHMQRTVAAMIDRSVTSITDHVVSKTASVAIASVDASLGAAIRSSNHAQHEQTEYGPRYTEEQGKPTGVSESTSEIGLTAPISSIASQHGQSGHPGPGVAEVYGFAEGQNANLAAYSRLHSFDASQYSPTEMKPTLDSHLNAIAPQQPLLNDASHGNLHPSVGFINSFQSPMTPRDGFNDNSGTSIMDLNGLQGSSTAWRHFTNNVMTNIAAHEYMTSANNFGVSGEVPRPPNTGGLDLTMPIQMASNPSNPNTHQGWPYIQYDMG